MKKRILLSIILLSVFIASCAPGETERGFGQGQAEQKTDAFSGTTGINLVLEQPQRIVTFPGETISFPLRVSNDGRYDTTVTLYVSGYDKSLVTYTQEQQTISLQGKKSAGLGQIIPGETKIVYFETQPVRLVGTSLQQDAVVTACFPYVTELTYGVCIDRNANRVCDITQPQNPSLSSGQAAPVSITSISSVAMGPSAGKTRVTYSIKFSQSDTGRIVNKNKLNDACLGRKLDERTDFDIIYIDEIRLGADVLLECPAIAGGMPLNLKYSDTLTCYAQVTYENTDYTSGLYVKASYGYLKSVTQPITIEALNQ